MLLRSAYVTFASKIGYLHSDPNAVRLILSHAPSAVFVWQSNGLVLAGVSSVFWRSQNLSVLLKHSNVYLNYDPVTDSVADEATFRAVPTWLCQAFKVSVYVAYLLICLALGAMNIQRHVRKYPLFVLLYFNKCRFNIGNKWTSFPVRMKSSLSSHLFPLPHCRCPG